MSYLYIFILLFSLTACTDATPQVSWLRNPPGPTLDASSYTVGEDSDLIISGTSRYASSDWKILVKGQNDTDWKNAEDVIDSSYDNDINLADGKFKFKVLKSLFNFEAQSKTESVHVKFISSKSGMETSESVFSLTIEAATEFTANADTPESRSNQTQLNLTISGNKVSEFSYKFGDSSIVDCSSNMGYSDVSSLSLSLDLSSLPDGEKKLCLLGKDSEGHIQNIQAPTEKIWILDTTAPTVGILETVPLYSNSTSLSFHVQSLNAEDPVVKYKYLHTTNDNNCLVDSNYSEEKDISDSISLNIASVNLNIRQYLCILAKDSAGNWTIISDYKKIDWMNDVQSPALPTTTSSGINSSKYQSPQFSMTTVSDSSGIANVYYKIINYQNGSELISWTTLGQNSNLFQLTLPAAVENTTYSLVLKITDNAGNVTEGTVSQWSHDITAPSINAYQVSASKSLQKTPVFYIGASDNSGYVYLLKVYVLNENNQIISGPETVSANSFYVGTVSLSRNTNYKLRIYAADQSSNSTEKDITFSSADCVSSNPNSVSYYGSICEEVSTDQTIGWKMQGGVIMAKESESKLLVAEIYTGTSSSITGPLIWGTYDSGEYISYTGFAGEKDPISKSYENSPVNERCRTMTKNSLNDWFLPNLTQLSKIYCNSTATPTSGYPSYDPGCSNTKVASVMSLGSDKLWTNSEYSAVKAYSFNPITGIENVEYKTTSNNYICVRSFSR